jgi:predicted nucleotidyltransferase
VIITEKTLRDTFSIPENTGDAYVLYGSYARGDYESASDVDILRITTERIPASRLDGHVLLHIYDIKDLLEMARMGSLFILHLMQEAKPIIDPSGYLRQISAAFRKPDSYFSAAHQMTMHASKLLDVDESLFGTAPRQFMNVAIFLCRTLIYADHADRGPFSFSLRSLATNDEFASTVCKIKGGSSSYSNFERLRHVVRMKLRSSDLCSNALSIDELREKGQGDLLFDGLLRRIMEGSEGAEYAFPPNAPTNESTNPSMATY